MRLFMILTILASSINNEVVAGSHFRRALNRAILEKISRDTSNKRNLQQIESISEGQDVCTGGGVGVNFDENDDFSLDAFNFQYETECECTEDNNTDELDALFDGPGLENITDISVILETVNSALRLLEINSEYSCENRCETCYGDDDTCGLLSVSETTVVKGSQNTTVTLEDILLIAAQGNETSGEDAIDFTKFLGEVNYEFELCMDYTMPNYGKLCFGANIDEIPENIVSTREVDCYISLAGVDCNECKLTLGEEDAPDCAVADCSNIPEYGATIDTCNNQGLTGPYEIIGIYQDDENPPGFQKGECGVISEGPKSNETETTSTKAPTDGTSAGTSTIYITSIVAATGTMIVFSIALMM